MITLSTTHLTDIEEHGREAYPEECCGAFLGDINFETNEKYVKKLIKLENVSDENRHRRFRITPTDYQDLEAQAKQQGLVLLGFYHTHPDHPAIPSETDLKFAWPVFSYVILSVIKGVPGKVTSHIIDLKSDTFVEENLVLC